MTNRRRGFEKKPNEWHANGPNKWPRNGKRNSGNWKRPDINHHPLNQRRHPFHRPHRQVHLAIHPLRHQHHHYPTIHLDPLVVNQELQKMLHRRQVHLEDHRLAHHLELRHQKRRTIQLNRPVNLDHLVAHLRQKTRQHQVRLDHSAVHLLPKTHQHRHPVPLDHLVLLQR